MARILVTGGSGMIGNEVVKQLLRAGHKVHVLDLYPIKIEGITHFKGSILEKESIMHAIDSCEYVVHFAALLGVANSTRNPLECLDVNILGTRNVLECCVANNIKRIIFSSSSEVYGDALRVPIKEEEVFQPKSEYGASKVVGEEYIKAFSKKFNLDYVILRFFGVYGPLQVNNFVVPLFVHNVLNDIPLQVYGDGKQIRAFTHVEDVAAATVKAIFSEQASKQVFNIGNAASETNILELAKLVLKVSGKGEEPVLVPFENSDRTKEREIFKRVPDTSKAKDILGFEAKVGLEEGIRRMIEYRKALL
ncbi:NAD-dependent epimerase/dehydratase family protein [Candidatus Woesearchaeota archaeon]|nr:NAD-dependent epimerase/dehydratase family protein [Candidatus Woesearchaeota archaeon]MBI2581541.1 NAD-dependent epimerase/dehydratase family protein [Candidatus Woesearchaeota archaeon]